MTRVQESQVSTDRKKWGKILDALVRMLQTQQKQIESLVKDKKLLEDHINRQYERSVSDVRLYYDHISQMKREFSSQDLIHAFEAAKSDLVLSLKQKEAFENKLKLGHVESELADFRVWFEYLSHKCSNAEDISPGNFMVNGRVKGGGGDGYRKSVNSTTKGEEQFARKLPFKTSDKIAALLSERNFVWKQFETMENEYASKLNSKRAEVEQEKENIQKLLAGMEQLQSTNNMKDETIVTLKAEVAELQADKNTKDVEIIRLSKELELPKKTRSFSVTPVLNSCTAALRNSKGGKKSGMDSTNFLVKKEVYASQLNKHVKDSKKGCQSLKRKGADIILITDTPKLFSSAFKVPKLKNSSPYVV